MLSLFSRPYLSMSPVTTTTASTQSQPSYRRLALISNPLSFTNRKLGSEALENMELHMETLGGWTAAVHDDESLDDAVQVALNESCDLIIANGGDGTIQGTISSLARLGRLDVPIAVMPGGRTNVIAADLGMPHSNVAAYHRLVEDWKSNKIRVEQRTVLKVSQENEQERYGFLINGAGLASFIEECWAFREKYRRWGMFGGLGTGVWVTGRLIAALCGARLFNPQKLSCYWYSSGSEQATQCTQVKPGLMAFSATTNKQLPLGISPYQDGKNQGSNACFKATAIEGSASAIAYRLIGGLLSGGRGYKAEHGFLTGTPNRLHIETVEPSSYHLDGERYVLSANNSIQISLGPSLPFVSYA